MENIEVRYTPANRWMRPLVPTLYAGFLAVTLMAARGASNFVVGSLFVLGVLITVVALRTWWQAWTFRLYADEEGITQSGALSRQHVAWKEVTALDVRREGVFNSDRAPAHRPLQSITLIGKDGILLSLGHDLRCATDSQREALLQFIEAHAPQGE